MIQSDPKYNNILITKFINHTMKKGKKFLAQKIVYGAFDIIKEKTKQNPLEVFSKALRNASPVVETKSRRVGGATYQVPMEVKGQRQTTLAMRWILDAAKKKKGQEMKKKLSEELILSAKGEGLAIKKKMDVERMAEANRAFAHLGRRRK